MDNSISRRNELVAGMENLLKQTAMKMNEFEKELAAIEHQRNDLLGAIEILDQQTESFQAILSRQNTVQAVPDTDYNAKAIDVSEFGKFTRR